MKVVPSEVRYLHVAVFITMYTVVLTYKVPSQFLSIEMRMCTLIE